MPPTLLAARRIRCETRAILEFMSSTVEARLQCKDSWAKLTGPLASRLQELAVSTVESCHAQIKDVRGE